METVTEVEAEVRKSQTYVPKDQQGNELQIGTYVLIPCRVIGFRRKPWNNFTMMTVFTEYTEGRELEIIDSQCVRMDHWT